VPLRNLSSILWHERWLVDRAGDEMTARLALQAAELDRAILVKSLADVLDLDDQVTLRELAARLPSPWGQVFDSHHAALSAGGTELPRSLADFLR
jgi:hypothetical protein